DVSPFRCGHYRWSLYPKPVASGLTHPALTALYNRRPFSPFGPERNTDVPDGLFDAAPHGTWNLVLTGRRRIGPGASRRPDLDRRPGKSTAHAPSGRYRTHARDAGLAHAKA